MASTNTINGLSDTPTFGYDYYLNGALKSERYPSGKLVNYDIDDAGRTNKVYTTSKTYADLTVTGNDESVYGGWTHCAAATGE